MNIVVDGTYLISGIYTNFRRLLWKKCDVGYHVINHGVMKLMITGRCLPVASLPATGPLAKKYLPGFPYS